MRPAVLLAAILTLAACSGADAPIPAGYAPVVESARASLEGNIEGPVRPSLAFTRIECYANGGLIVFFIQVGGLWPGEPAFAMGGGGAAPGAWSGGFGSAADIQEEIDFNFGGVARVPCPPREPA